MFSVTIDRRTYGRSMRYGRYTEMVVQLMGENNKAKINSTPALLGTNNNRSHKTLNSSEKCKIVNTEDIMKKKAFL